MTTRLTLLSLLLLVATVITSAQRGTPRMTQSMEATAVAEILRQMFVAAAADDLAKFHSLTTPGFYAFDNGRRYDGDALMQMIISAHARGMKAVWSVRQPDVHVLGETAWIAYTNVGSIQASAVAEPTPMTWLESAFLERRDGSWKIVFFQSSRADAGTP